MLCRHTQSAAWTKRQYIYCLSKSSIINRKEIDAVKIKSFINPCFPTVRQCLPLEDQLDHGAPLMLHTLPIGILWSVKAMFVILTLVSDGMLKIVILNYALGPPHTQHKNMQPQVFYFSGVLESSGLRTLHMCLYRRP